MPCYYQSTLKTTIFFFYFYAQYIAKSIPRPDRVEIKHNPETTTTASKHTYLPGQLPVSSESQARPSEPRTYTRYITR